MNVLNFLPSSQHNNEINDMRKRLNELKEKHHTKDSLEALDREGETYSVYPDERATPRFLTTLDRGITRKYRSVFNYTLELNVVLGRPEFAIVLRK